MVVNKKILKELISIVMIVSMLGFLPVSAAMISGKMESPATPITVGINMPYMPALNEAADVIITASSVLDAPETRVELILPGGASLVSDTSTWQANLTANIPATFSARIIITKNGNWEMKAIARRVVDQDNIWGDIDILYINMDNNAAIDSPLPTSNIVDAVGRNTPENIKIINETAAKAYVSHPEVSPPPRNIQKNNINKDSVTVAGTVTVAGRFGYYTKPGDYRDVSNTFVWAKYFLVELVDGSGNHLAFGYTDANGYFEIPITNPGGSGVRAWWRTYDNPGDELMTVAPGGSGWSNTYITQSPVFYLADGYQNIGDWELGQGNTFEGAYWIKDDLTRGWSSVPNSPGGGIAEWSYTSTDGTYYSVGGHIHLKGVDRISPDTVVHEYGHNVMYNIYGNWFPTNDCPSPHYIELIGGSNCGWTEGWGDFFSLYVNGNPVYTWPSGAALNLETPTWGTSGWDSGDRVEGRVAGSLWDIYDSANDGNDQFTDGVSNIWSAIYNQNDNTFAEYWSELKTKYPNDYNARAALFQNTIDYNTPPYTPSNPSPSNGAINRPFAQTLSWSGGDFNFDTVTYTTYLDTSINPSTQRCQTTTIFCSISGLNPSTTYYWKVVATDGLEWAYGPTWSFTTKAALPLGEAVDNYVLSFSTGGNGNWFGEDGTYYYGGDAAQSGRILDGQYNWIQTAVTGPGTLNFYWKVSSESTWDYLRFYIDGVQQDGISGEIDWQQKSYNLGSGAHTLRWNYTKDAECCVSGIDAGWLDKVEFIPQLVVTVSEAPDPINSGGTSVVTAHVTAQGSPVSGASVSFSTTGGTLSPISGTTDYYGNIVSIYTPPAVATPTAYTITATASNTGYVSGTGSDSITVRPAISLGEAVDNIALAWTTGGNANWYGEDSIFNNGGDAAQSGRILDGQGTWIQTLVTGPGTLNFNWNVSSETGWDFLTFTIDGVQQATISGETGWQQKNYNIASGTHTLKWNYTKDSQCCIGGSDAAWLDKVEFSPQLNVTISESPDPINSGGTSLVTVHVTAQGLSVSGASVNVWATGGTLSPINGTTDAAGNFVSIYTPPAVSTPTTYTVIASGIKTGYASFNSTDLITVRPAISLGEAVDNTALAWTTGGNANWYGEDVIFNNGGDAARSGIISHGQGTGVQTSVTGPGMLNFTWNVSSETGWDFLTFTIDGVQQAAISGETGWQQKNYSIASGTHTLKWNYTKDAICCVSGSDAAWLDKVEFSSQLNVTVSESPDPISSGGTSLVTVYVTTSGGTPVSGASVSLSATGGTLSPTSGTTNATGGLTSTYTAPIVGTTTTYTISGTATKAGYTGGSGSDPITVNPPASSPLYVSISESPDPVNSSSTSLVTVQVTTTGGALVSGASVNVSATGGTLSPTSGTTDVNGDFKPTYTAPVVGITTNFTISGTATKSGYTGGSGSDTITVIPPAASPLNVSISESPDPVNSGETSLVTVYVTTTGGTPVSGASVSLSATGGTLSPTSGTTNATGGLTSTYTAPIVGTTTTYTISGTATKSGYTSGSGSDPITVNPTGSADNVVSIEDVLAPQASETRVPIRIINSTGIASVSVKLNYNASVVLAYSDPILDKGDFTDFYAADNSQNASGSILITTMKFAPGSTEQVPLPLALTGNPVVGYVRLRAVGNGGDTSRLDLSGIVLTDDNGDDVTYAVRNGSFTIVSDPNPPIVTNPAANQSDIPDDTDSIPLWGETARLNVTVTDASGIASVTVNLAQIGGPAAKPMINIGGNVYSTTTNASAGTVPNLYNLTVTATDTFGNPNSSVKIGLRVRKNGDTNGNNAVNIGDGLRLANNVSYPGNPAYALSSIYVADVSGNGIINIGDALRLANNVSYPGNPAYILK